MKLDLSKVQFSKYDISHNVKIPRKLTPDLAYFSGIHFGDGNIGNYKKHYYSLEYSGHIIDEYEFYTVYFKKLFKSVFNKDLRVYEKYKDKGDYLNLCTQSKAIFTFLKNSIGLPVGKKVNWPLPKLIIESRYRRAFIRGLADSDFCLSFKKRDKELHYYPTISIRSSSKIMIMQLDKLLKDIGFKTNTLFDFISKRYEKSHVGHQLEINGTEQQDFWIEKIGFNSRKHLTKYYIWEKFGFCPPQTTLPQRELILEGQLNPYNFYKKNITPRGRLSLNQDSNSVILLERLPTP